MHGTPVADEAPDMDAFDASDWAWEFLRRNRAYRMDWRAAVPRSLPMTTLSDGTVQLRLRRRYPSAEAWGLSAFANPSQAARNTPVFWLADVLRRAVTAKLTARSDASPAMRLSEFRAMRHAMIDADGRTVLSLKGNGFSAAIRTESRAILTRPFDLKFELNGFQDLAVQTEALKDLQRLSGPDAAKSARSPFSDDTRLRHTLTALDMSLEGKTYRQIAIALLGEARVAEDWNAASRSLKDRMRRLVAKGHELMNGGYRDLLR